MTDWAGRIRFISRIRKNTNDKRSVFSTLLISYLIVLLLPAAVGFLLYDRIEGAMIESANQSNFSLLEQAQQVIDQKINEINHIAVQISYEPKLPYLMDQSNVDDSSDIYKFIEFMENISKYQTGNDFINQFFVYMKKSDTIVTPSMKTDSRTFIEQVLQFPDSGYSPMISELSSYHWRYSPSETDIVSQLTNNHVMAYIQSLPLNRNQATEGAIVILINKQELLDRINQIVQNNEGNVYILNDQNQVLLSTSPSIQPGDVPLGNMQEDRGSFLTRINHANMYVSFIKSDQNQWTYLSVVPRKVILSRIAKFKLWAIVILLSYLAIGALFCRYLAYRHYRPIRELVHSIVSGKTQDKTRIFNEYNFIKRTLSVLSDEKESLSQTLNKQSPVIQADFISRLMRGQIDGRNITKADLESAGVQFDSNQFRVIIVTIDDFSQFTDGTNEREWTLMRFIISNLSRDLWQGQLYSVDLKHDQVGLLLSCKADQEEETPAFADELRSMIDQRFRTCLTIAVSNLHSGLDNIPVCYGEATLALDCKMFNERNAIIYYYKIPTMKNQLYQYPMETEARLINYVKSGDETNTLNLLKQIFEINLYENGISASMGKCLFFELRGTLLKLHSNLNIPFPQWTKAVEENFQLGPVANMNKDEMMERIIREFREICRAVRNNQSEHSETLVKRIVEFVEQHYADSMLSLNQIADEFDMNPSYLSAFFKKQKGQNLSDYIIGLRIRRAKEMMKEERLTIQEIALAVGYTNDVGFIRVFKKVEGIPPGKYRKTLTLQT